jgi:hypothetical protein
LIHVIYEAQGKNRDEKTHEGQKTLKTGHPILLQKYINYEKFRLSRDERRLEVNT